jgi:muramoyltetrapeptide carboxypeptidase
MPSRREFLKVAGASMGGSVLARHATPEPAEAPPPPTLKPPRLSRGEAVGLINPSSTPLGPQDVATVRDALAGLGLRAVDAPGLAAAREDIEARADDIHAMFEDAGVRAILPVRGGWGCARLLQRLDYDLIRARPKVIMGYSDVAALLVGIHSRTGLVTFHGPMGTSAWVPFTVEQMKRVVFRGEAALLSPPPPAVEPRGRIRTITGGRARGRLLGGNLTVVSSMVGSSFLRSADDLVLFLEEVREPVSEVDRMLTQLEMAGILGRIRGLVFGQCTRCMPPEADFSLTLDRVLDDHVARLGVPAWRGALIGHVERQLTLPIGVPVEIDAGRGSIRLLEPAVT